MLGYAQAEFLILILNGTTRVANSRSSCTSHINMMGAGTIVWACTDFKALFLQKFANDFYESFKMSCFTAILTYCPLNRLTCLQLYCLISHTKFGLPIWAAPPLFYVSFAAFASTPVVFHSSALICWFWNSWSLKYVVSDFRTCLQLFWLFLALVVGILMKVLSRYKVLCFAFFHVWNPVLCQKLLHQSCTTSTWSFMNQNSFLIA